jgi:precorrin-6A synthase
MKKILIIGIGAGDPDYVTMQAVKALNGVDVFFIMDKGPGKAALIELRKEILRRYVKDRSYRFADAESPAWDRESKDYCSTVDDLNRDKQAVFERLIAEEMADGEVGGFLIWGDPMLYDSTIRIVENIVKAGVHALEYEVIPGITSIQALTAKHKVTLNRIGQSVDVTTGRKLIEGAPDIADSVAVMLDGDNSYLAFADQDIDIYWGAYVGMPEEILISGKLKDVAEEIRRVRAEARRANGWIMDCYLMRKAGGNGI